MSGYMCKVVAVWFSHNKTERTCLQCYPYVVMERAWPLYFLNVLKCAKVALFLILFSLPSIFPSSWGELMLLGGSFSRKKTASVLAKVATLGDCCSVLATLRVISPLKITLNCLRIDAKAAMCTVQLGGSGRSLQWSSTCQVFAWCDASKRVLGGVKGTRHTILSRDC